MTGYADHGQLSPVAWGRVPITARARRAGLPGLRGSAIIAGPRVAGKELDVDHR
jgi:hypothetical protein